MEKLDSQYPADALAEALEVSESGFAAHRRKEKRPRRQRDAQLRPLIRQSFAKSRRTYGCPRVQRDLRESGQRCGKNRIARLMRECALRPRQKRRFRPATTDSRHPHKVAENWLAKVT
jgi:transposase InsO family protein